MAERPRVCIVEAYSSSSLCYSDLARRGFDVVHVQAQVPVAPFFAEYIKPEKWIENIEFDGDRDKLLRRVAAHRPVAVFTGTDTGIAVCDMIGEALGLPTNGTAQSAVRRSHKGLQQARLAEVGVRSIRTLMSRDWSEIEAWITKLGKFPIVTKPPSAATTNNVFICRNLAEVREAFDITLDRPTVYEEVADRIVVQEYIDGDEYVLNTASCAGHHYMTDLWHVEKVRTGRSPLYDLCIVQPSTGALQDRLYRYACSVLDAFGLRYGPGHMEIMVDDDGPVLIEVGARPGGQKTPVVCQEILGFSQLTAMVDAYVSPETFFARKPYELKRHNGMVQLICPRTGTLSALPRLDAVKQLRSLFTVMMGVEVGKPIKQTVDMATVPGIVHLIHDDPQVVAEDYRQIRAWEADDFYVIR